MWLSTNKPACSAVVCANQWWLAAALVLNRQKHHWRFDRSINCKGFWHCGPLAWAERLAVDCFSTSAGAIDLETSSQHTTNGLLTWSFALTRKGIDEGFSYSQGIAIAIATRATLHSRLSCLYDMSAQRIDLDTKDSSLIRKTQVFTLANEECCIDAYMESLQMNKM